LGSILDLPYLHVTIFAEKTDLTHFVAYVMLVGYLGGGGGGMGGGALGIGDERID